MPDTQQPRPGQPAHGAQSVREILTAQLGGCYRCKRSEANPLSYVPRAMAQPQRIVLECAGCATGVPTPGMLQPGG